MERFFETPSLWREWLSVHHATEKVIWLIFYKVHTRRGGLRYDEALDEALCFGWIDSIVKRLDDERYLQKFTPRTNTFKWSDANVARVRRLITEGRMTDIGLAKVGDRAILEREPIEPVRDRAGGMQNLDASAGAGGIPARLSGPGSRPPEPEDPDFVREAFAADPPAAAAFRALTPGRRRLYLRWVLDARRDETRRKRFGELIGLLREGKPLSMK